MKNGKLCVAFDRGERTKQYVECASKKDIIIKTVDCCADDIMQQLEDVDALVWHWTHARYEQKRNAKNVLEAAAKKGIWVYPDLNTCMSFDDKVAQKYLLEAIDAPFVETHVFWDKLQAEQWIAKATFPVVHKLAGGAGSTNVMLIHDAKEARKVCRRRFASHYSIKEILGNRSTLRGMLRYFIKEVNERYMGLDKGYVLFQKFLPDNAYDIRVTVIGEKAVIFKRYVRENDFRASGSGKIDYTVSEQDKQAIPIAFEVADKLKTQTIALDFAYDVDKELKIIEISYGFVSKAVQAAGGYYDRNLRWQEGAVVVEEEVLKMIMDQLLKSDRS